VSKVKIGDLVKRGKIRIINLASKIDEIKGNQLLLLKDDMEDAKILLEEDRFRGAFIHAFDALERAVDVFLIEKKYKISDRFSRKVAIGELLGKEFLGEYEDLFDLRKEGMYDRHGAIGEADVEKLLSVTVPMVLKKADAGFRR
jgi:uncharacterized protein (UPF0332 family)